MQYLLLIYDTEASWKTMPEGRRHTMFAAYGTLTDDLKAKSQWIGGNALQGIETATSVRVRDGKTTITDGPFAETREQLGGYYLVEAKDLDEATAIAARIPSAQIGTIEVRPIMNYNAQVDRSNR